MRVKDSPTSHQKWKYKRYKWAMQSKIEMKGKILYLIGWKLKSYESLKRYEILRDIVIQWIIKKT